MSAAELDLVTLQRLLPVANAEQVSVLLGAGASAAAGLPDWNSLATQLLQLSGTIDDEETARAFLAGQDPSLAAEAARAGVGNWLELVREALYPPSPVETEPAALHLAVASLAAGRPVGDVGLFTLNFDLLIEWALQDALEEVGSDAGVQARDTEDDRAPRGAFEVHHLHGYLGQDPADTGEIVLTLSDFTKLSAQSSPWQRAELQGALSRGPLLLAGTSYRDSDIRQWLHELKLATRPDKGFILLARESFGLSRQQFDLVKDALVAQWASIGVSAVLVQDHSDAAQAIRELSALNRADYLAPKVRAGALWDAIKGDFDQLQPEHSDQLARDLTRLRPVLGDDANMTLWLADGAGQIVRWSSHDRLYRSPEQLRTVPVGHDSPWIAGQSLGSSDIWARDLSEAMSTRRWQSVVAAPCVAELPGGPPLPTAVLSSAATTSLEDQDVDAWREVLTDLAEEWAERQVWTS
ncbi:SIR2 family protein [Archangium violaceum]|uniref:SIR2 family protein n=1 Tax=Archangium violaceum TaxID=83451 RepID=UPI00193AE36B|nr:SIR2 family protein [Archangium violaceum]QRK07329.1 SIR2 family protein [Archangium violaceum]